MYLWSRRGWIGAFGMSLLLVVSAASVEASECQAQAWCSDTRSHAFNNMHAGTFGEMFEPAGKATFSLCGFQLKIGEGTGAIGRVDGNCRGVLYQVNADDSILELAAVSLNGAAGATDFIFASPVAIDSGQRYAVVIETNDNYWGLWQNCNAGENCCSDARPVRIEKGSAVYNDPSVDDYYFQLWIR